MSIIAEYLFGSHARADATTGSDVDILAVTRRGSFASFERGTLNVSIYPSHRLLASAEEGDLFVMHIVMEAVLIYSSSNFDSKLRKLFKPKSNYEFDVVKASDLGNFLVSFGDRFSDKKMLRKRISWCVRTILIARSVVSGSPTFGPAALLNLYPSAEASRLIGMKRGDDYRSMIADLKRFLAANGSSEFSNRDVSLRQYWTKFRLDDNKLATSTFRSFASGLSGDFEY